MHIHKWTKWSEILVGKTASFQHSTCARCNKIRARVIVVDEF